MRILFAALACFLSYSGFAAAQSFTLKPGDVISVTVLEDENLSRVALVQPDGLISLPLAGTIQAEGRTPEQVQQAILARLASDFITPPTVTVSLQSLGAESLEEGVEERAEDDGIPGIDEEAAALPGQVYVIGVVGRPGAVLIEPGRRLTVLQALALAGGPGVFAAIKRIQVRRLTETGEEVFLFNYNDVEDGDRTVEPLVLVDGDVIVVPERGLFE
ncbi:MAG: polysaccharide biosynthesis/export family protein [Pseudomonadota bacterium]